MIIPNATPINGQFDSATRGLIYEHRNHTQAFDYRDQDWTHGDHVHADYDGNGSFNVTACGALLAECEPFLAVPILGLLKRVGLA